jgi:short-subunit dehydrogenase
VADLSTEAGQEKVIKELAAEHYDILVNNAGVGTVGRFTDIPLEKQKAMLHLNCEAVATLSYSFLKTARSGDALINVSSTLAFLPMPYMGLYCATKSFVTALTETLWFENQAQGIYVMGLCPGITDTNFQIAAGGRKEDLPKNMAQTPDQVVEVALRALRERREPTVISGVKNAIFTGISRIMPRKRTVSMLGKMSSRAPH